MKSSRADEACHGFNEPAPLAGPPIPQIFKSAACEIPTAVPGTRIGPVTLHNASTSVGSKLQPTPSELHSAGPKAFGLMQTDSGSPSFSQADNDIHFGSNVSEIYHNFECIIIGPLWAVFVRFAVGVGVGAPFCCVIIVRVSLDHLLSLKR